MICILHKITIKKLKYSSEKQHLTLTSQSRYTSNKKKAVRNEPSRF